VSSLLLKRASASRPSGEWSDDDFDVLANGGVPMAVAAGLSGGRHSLVSIEQLVSMANSGPTRADPYGSAGGQLRALNRLRAEALATLPSASMPLR
jgi:hypothetical protein